MMWELVRPLTYRMLKVSNISAKKLFLSDWTMRKSLLISNKQQHLGTSPLLLIQSAIESVNKRIWSISNSSFPKLSCVALSNVEGQSNTGKMEAGSSQVCNMQGLSPFLNRRPVDFQSTANFICETSSQLIPR